MVDEINDKKSEKRLGMLVRYFDDGLGRSVTLLLDMPVCNDRRHRSTARSTQLSRNHLLKTGLSYYN